METPKHSQTAFMCSCLANKADSDRAQSRSHDGASKMDVAAKGAADSEMWLLLTRR